MKNDRHTQLKTSYDEYAKNLQVAVETWDWDDEIYFEHLINMLEKEMSEFED